MRKSLLPLIRCLDCGRSGWDLEIDLENAHEIRTGRLRCQGCGKNYGIQDGILNALEDSLALEVLHEKEHAESFGYVVDENGSGHAINRETLHRFRDVFLRLPEGDERHFFQPGGSFDNQSGNAARYFKTLDLMGLTGQERVLEVGASFGWSPWHFAQRGCRVVALDVTHYLMAADLFFEKDGSYFDRVMADMNRLPFQDESFDIIFSHSVAHHSKNLKTLFREFLRVLRPGGRVVALHECAFGIFEDKSGKALQEAIREGFNENAYTIPQWKRGFRDAGFGEVRCHFFSFIEDYITRKEKRRSSPNLKLKLAYWIRDHSGCHRLLNGMSVVPRLLFRPKAWMIVARKNKTRVLA